MPGLVLNALNDNQRRFLNMFGLNRIPLVCQVIGQIIHVLLCFLFVQRMDLEILGIGYAGSISGLVIYICMLAYSLLIDEIRPAI